MRARWDTALSVTAIVLLAAGDAVRYLVGYAGWGVVCVVVLAAAIVTLVRRRPAFRVAWPLALLLVLMTASAIWSVSAPATLLGAALQLATAVAGALLATLGVERVSVLLERSLLGILAASLVFEVLVAVLVGGRVYPLVPLPGASYDGPDVPAAYAWSRGELLEGGRIQGVVGNANLLAMLALVAAILVICRCAAARDARSAAWLVLPVVTLALTRSATVLLAAAAVVAAAVVLVIVARTSGRTRRAILGILAAVAVATVAAAVALREPLLAALGRDADLTGRLDIWSAVVGEWATSPVVGIGWFGYWPPWIAPFDTLAIHDGVRYLQAHSVALDVLMQLGLVGLATWTALVVTAVVVAVRHWRATEGARRAFAAAPLLLLVAFGAQGLAESRPLIELPFALLVALVAVPAPTPVGRPHAYGVGAR